MISLRHCHGGCLFAMVIALGLAMTVGCPAPTPGERMGQLKGRIVEGGNPIIDLDLSGTKVSASALLWASGIADRSLGVITGPVAAPLHHIAVHIIQSPGVRIFLADWRRFSFTVRREPTVVIS